MLLAAVGIDAVGIDAVGIKHPLGVIEGATENTATVRALLNNLIERGLDPAVSRLFIVDGAKALSKSIRQVFGPDTLIQRCQVHKARNIIERLPKHFHASVRKTLRQAWEMDDPAKAEKLIRSLAQRLEREAPGVSAIILEGLDEILTVTRDVKHWQDASMALRWTGAAMQEAAKGFRRRKAYRQLSFLRAALAAHQAKHAVKPALDRQAVAA